ncbi:hypothetical protein CCR75_008398 [Bremia lactucae]|uniref:Uncharacterized protein n=1 Tax=Bremia lactucae TaxID=4779 RepID=A0A976IDW8_BRELC|nr:hypothetical protein CCR75_008398 [Bremia lactucae]
MTTREKYRRVSTKFKDNTITSLGRNAVPGPNLSQQLANEMADGWSSIMQCSQHSQASTTTIIGMAGRSPNVNDAAIVATIEGSLIEMTMSKLKRGKAAGPDELNNCFYCDRAYKIAPILAQLLARWMETDCYPSSFAPPRPPSDLADQHWLQSLNEDSRDDIAHSLA